MKTRLLVSVAIVAIAISRGSAAQNAPARPTEDAQAEIITVHDASVAAAESLNVDALVSALAENNAGALIINGRLVLTRAEVVDTTRANFRGIKKLKYTLGPRHVTLLSPDAAVLVTTGTLAVDTDDGQSFTRAFAHTFVYVRQGGAWRVLHSHQSNPLDR